LQARSTPVVDMQLSSVGHCPWRSGSTLVAAVLIRTRPDSALYGRNDRMLSIF